MADKEAVETTQEAASEAVVEKKEVSATDTQGVDLAEKLEKTLEQLAKSEEERDNYKRGMLKAKGKTDEDEDDDSEEEKLFKKLEARLKDSETEKARKEAADLTKQLIKRNKEMEEALKNKSQMSGAATGTGTESQLKVGDNQLSEAQLAELKKRGWNEEKIARFKQNLLKIR